MMTGNDERYGRICATSTIAGMGPDLCWERSKEETITNSKE